MVSAAPFLKDMTKGIILIAYGKPEYIYMAAHMAASLRYYSPDIPITILHDDNIRYLPTQYYEFIDGFVEMDSRHLKTNGKIDPGKAKCNIIHYLPYDLNLYLDVDGLCIGDVTPLFDTDKDFCVEVTGKGGYQDDIEYNHWANPEDQWEHFELDDDTVLRTVQSSSMLFRKGEFCDNLQHALNDYFDFPHAKLKNHWGWGIPDELIYSGVLAKMKHDPSFNQSVVFFGHVHSPLSFKEIHEKYKVLSMYGNGKGRTLVKLKYIDWYNRLNINIHDFLKIDRIKEIQRLMKGKHVG